MFPFNKVVKMDDKSKDQFKTILDRKDQKRLTIDEAKIILSLYQKHFNINVESCATCGGVYSSIMKKLIKLYNYDV